MIQPFWKTVGQPAKNINLPYDLSILHLANQMSDRKQIGGWGGKGEGNHKEEGLDYSGVFTGICMSQNISNCTL